jgi:hypothetical protein
VTNGTCGKVNLDWPFLGHICSYACFFFVAEADIKTEMVGHYRGGGEVLYLASK